MHANDTLLFGTVWDLFTDTWVLFTKVLDAKGECKQNIANLVIPWLTCYAIATVASVVALCLKATIFRDQIRRRRFEFALEEEEPTDRITKLAKHNKRLTKTKRQILLVYSGILPGVAEYAPPRTLLSSRRSSLALLGQTGASRSARCRSYTLCSAATNPT